MRYAKSQMWSSDFVIGFFIFSLMLVAYYTYTTNLSKQDAVVVGDLVSEAQIVSSSLMSEGLPSNWDSSTVTRIGITDKSNRIDLDKFIDFNQLDYNDTKKMLGTVYDYFLYFVNESDDVKNVEGYCGTGVGDVNITYDLDAAYYYDGPGEEEFLKNFMEETFGADIYFAQNKGATNGVNDEDAFFLNIGNYDFVVVEHPVWSNSHFGDFVDAVDDPIDSWLENGGVLFMGGEIGTSKNSNGFGVSFVKVTGVAPSDELATVVNEDEFIAFSYADNIIFNQAYWVEDISVGTDLKDIARFNCSFSPRTCYDEIEDIAINGPMALARWPVDDGKILFFSDFDADYLSGNFQEILEGSAQRWANAICLPINISNIERENLVRTDRMVIYKSKLIKMVLYLWQ